METKTVPEMLREIGLGFPEATGRLADAIGISRTTLGEVIDSGKTKSPGVQSKIVTAHRVALAEREGFRAYDIDRKREQATGILAAMSDQAVAEMHTLIMDRFRRDLEENYKPLTTPTSGKDSGNPNRRPDDVETAGSSVRQD